MNNAGRSRAGWSSLTGAAWIATASLALAGMGVYLAGGDHESVRRFASVDFYEYYFGAAAVRAGSDPFDAELAHRSAEAAGVPILPESAFVYPAWFAAALVPLTLLSPRAAAALWFAISASILVAFVISFVRFESRRWALGAFLFPPALGTLFVGQVNLLLLGLLALAWCLRERRPALAGMCVGIAAAIKLAPALLLFPLLAQRRFRAVIFAIVAIAGAVVLGELIVPGSTGRYVFEIVPRISELEPWLAHPVNQSLGAFFLRLLAPNAWTSPWWNAPELVRGATGAASIALLALLLTTARGSELDQWSASIAALVVISSRAWEWSFVLLLLPLALLFRERGPRSVIIVAALAIAAQRALDPFALAPETMSWLAATPPLCSLCLYGALILFAHAVRAAHATPRKRALG